MTRDEELLMEWDDTLGKATAAIEEGLVELDHVRVDRCVLSFDLGCEFSAEHPQDLAAALRLMADKIDGGAK